MKKIFYSLLVVALVACSACKKDSAPDSTPVPLKTFENITYADIQTFKTDLKTDVITVSNNINSQLVKDGSIIFYKTNAGLFGKFKVVGISAQDQLIISLVNYDNQGAVILSKNSIIIEATYFADLDLGIQVPSQNSADFFWEPGALSYISPKNTSSFYIYSK
jgi:uncharacterized protein YcfL